MLIGEGVEGGVVADCYFLKSILKVGVFFKKAIINVIPINVRSIQHRACWTDARVQIHLPSVLRAHVLKVQAGSMQASRGGGDTKHGLSLGGWSTRILNCNVCQRCSYLRCLSARNGALGSVLALCPSIALLF